MEGLLGNIFRKEDNIETSHFCLGRGKKTTHIYTLQFKIVPVSSLGTLPQLAILTVSV